MQLEITAKAMEELSVIKQEEDQFLLLFYDIAGCGCGVNGIPSIRFANKWQPSYMEVACQQQIVAISEQQATFFADQMKLDIVNGLFRLSSSGEILNAFISPRSILLGS